MENNKKHYMIKLFLVIVLMIGLCMGMIISNKNKLLYNKNTIELNETSDFSTKEIPNSSKEEEQKIEDENVENESLEEQGNIAYNGDYVSDGYTLGTYGGLTYYSQLDSAWNSYPYTSTGNSTQTMGSSGCGPTSAAMIVSSIKGKILPYEMRRPFCFPWV